MIYVLTVLAVGVGAAMGVMIGVALMSSPESGRVPPPPPTTRAKPRPSRPRGQQGTRRLSSMRYRPDPHRSEDPPWPQRILIPDDTHVCESYEEWAELCRQGGEIHQDLLHNMLIYEAPDGTRHGISEHALLEADLHTRRHRSKNRGEQQ